MFKSLYERIFVKPSYAGSIRTHLLRGELDLAMSKADRLLEMEPERGEYHRLRAEVHFRKDDYPAALRDLERALSYDDSPENACQVYVLRGAIYSRQDEPAQAIRDYTKAIHTSTLHSMPAFVQRGKLYLQTEDYAKAVEDFSTALRFEIMSTVRDKALIRTLRGDAYVALKRDDDAIEDYRKARYYDPRSTQAHTQLARLYIKQGLYQAALGVLNEALRADPANADNYGKMRDEVSSKLGYTSAEDQLVGGEGKVSPGTFLEAPSSEAAPQQDEGARYHERALNRARRGDLTGALADIEEALRRHPRQPEYLVLRGNICYGSGKYDGALASFRSVQATHDEDAINAGLAGEALTLYALGDIDDARATWHQLVERDSAFSDLDTAQQRLQWADQSMDIVRRMLAV